MLTTSFKLLEASDFDNMHYGNLSDQLGGVDSYGKTTPISIVEVLNHCSLAGALEALGHCNEPVTALRVSRLFAADCAEQALPVVSYYFPWKVRHLEAAIETAREFAHGGCKGKKLKYAMIACERIAREMKNFNQSCELAATAASWACKDLDFLNDQEGLNPLAEKTMSFADLSILMFFTQRRGELKKAIMQGAADAVEKHLDITLRGIFGGEMREAVTMTAKNSVFSSLSEQFRAEEEMNILNSFVEKKENQEDSKISSKEQFYAPFLYNVWSAITNSVLNLNESRFRWLFLSLLRDC